MLGDAFTGSAGWGHAHPALISDGCCCASALTFQVHGLRWGAMQTTGIGTVFWLPPSPRFFSELQAATKDAVPYAPGICKGERAYLKMHWFLLGHGGRLGLVMRTRSSCIGSGQAVGGRLARTWRYPARRLVTTPMIAVGLAAPAVASVLTDVLAGSESRRRQAGRRLRQRVARPRAVVVAARVPAARGGEHGRRPLHLGSERHHLHADGTRKPRARACGSRRTGCPGRVAKPSSSREPFQCTADSCPLPSSPSLLLLSTRLLQQPSDRAAPSVSCREPSPP